MCVLQGICRVVITKEDRHNFVPVVCKIRLYKRSLAGITDRLGEYDLLRFTEFQNVFDFLSVKQTADDRCQSFGGSIKINILRSTAGVIARIHRLKFRRIADGCHL